MFLITYTCDAGQGASSCLRIKKETAQARLRTWGVSFQPAGEEDRILIVLSPDTEIHPDPRDGTAILNRLDVLVGNVVGRPPGEGRKIASTEDVPLARTKPARLAP
jgi:hypothetical protein